MARALVDPGAQAAITSRDADRAGHAGAGLGKGTLGLALDARDERAVVAGVAEVWERSRADRLAVAASDLEGAPHSSSPAAVASARG